MAWIELHQTLWTHRKTLILGAELGIEPDLAAARVVRLWCWCLDNCPDGDLSSLPAAVLAAGANCPGDPDAFVQALVRAGFAEREGQRLLLHDWWEYAGRLIERRREDALRKRAARARQPIAQPVPSEVSAAVPPPVQPMVTGMSDAAPADVRRNRTVPNSTVPHSTQPEDDDDGPVRSRDSHVVAVVDPPSGLDAVQAALLERLCATLPGIRGSPHHEALLAALIRDYPAVDLVFEAARCRSHHGAGRRRWATSFADWVTRARSVRLVDGSEGPPNSVLEIGQEVDDTRQVVLVSSGIAAWDAARAELAAAMLPGAFEQWFGCLDAVSLVDNCLTLRAHSEYHRDWLRDRLDHRVRHALDVSGFPEVFPSFIYGEGETGE